MKVLVYDPQKCTGCGTCEETCSQTYFKVSDRNRARLRVSAAGDGGFTAITCTQCGTCMEVCPTLALSRNKLGVVVLKKSLCVGCLSCVGFCPEHAMFYYDGSPEPFKCIACGKCAAACPEHALEIREVEEVDLTLTESKYLVAR